MISQASLDAVTAAGAQRTFCSWQVGWRNVLLREYEDPLYIDEYLTTPSPDQKIVLVTAGSCEIESSDRNAWRCAHYRPGHIGLVAPGVAARLRWRGREHHQTTQLHLPGALIECVADGLFGPRRGRNGPLHGLSVIDPVVAATMLALGRAARTGAPDLYAETAAHFLASHLLLRRSRYDAQLGALPGAPTAMRLEEYMRAHLSRTISLGELAVVAGVSRFQLLRMAKRAWGETPQRRLTRLRMQHAQHLLTSKRLTVIEVSLECGYANATHFATAFRRCTGLTPSAFRRTS